MYTYVGMIIEPASNSEETLDKAESILAKYDLTVEVPEYKYYFDADEINLMKKRYNSSDLNVLAEEITDWTGGEPGGVDEKGLYVTTTRNPDGHFDSWQIFGPGELKPGMFTTSDAYCEAIILDDGMWQASPDVHGLPPVEQNRIMDAWEVWLEGTIKEQLGKTALIVRCHR